MKSGDGLVVRAYRVEYRGEVVTGAINVPNVRRWRDLARVTIKRKAPPTLGWPKSFIRTAKITWL